MYTVEKIIKKKLVNGKIHYFVKWSGYSSKENTWEPLKNLNCPKLLDEFEASQINKKTIKKNTKQAGLSVATRFSARIASASTSASTSAVASVSTSSPSVSLRRNNSSDVSEEEKESDMESEMEISDDPVEYPNASPSTCTDYQGKVVEYIVGIQNIDGELKYLIKWQDINDAEFVPFVVANKEWPQMVIRFYEERYNFC